jgi:glucokinase
MNIGIDVGGTEIKAGIISDSRIIKRASVKTGRTKKEVVGNIISVIEKIINKNTTFIGIGVPGPADYDKGIIGNTPNIALKGVNLKRIISSRFRKKVILDNDANCFVLGEAARLGKKNVVGLTLGTGVGGGIVIGCRLYRGKGNAGELGHCTIRYDGPKSRFNDGCLESYVSTKSIIRDYGADPAELKSKKAWNSIGAKLGIGIANLINAFDPDVVVLGGGISKSFDRFKTGMNQEIKKRAITKTKVIRGKEDSGIIGAANLQNQADP